jgi:hypothetical protein
MNDIIRNNAIETWVNCIITNYKQILLVIMVLLIIYSVEYMAYVNTLLYGMLAMPSIPGVTNSTQIPTKKKKK